MSGEGSEGKRMKRRKREEKANAEGLKDFAPPYICFLDLVTTHLIHVE